jgi:hypothetical protein
MRLVRLGLKGAAAQLDERQAEATHERSP